MCYTRQTKLIETAEKKCGAGVVDYLRQTLDKISEVLIHMETARLNSESSITDYVKRLYVICGMKYLLTIIKRLERGDKAVIVW